MSVLVEEAGKALRRPLADVGVGAEREPRTGHAREAAERLVGHPRQDLQKGTLGDAHHSLLLLPPLQTEETVRIGRVPSMNRRSEGEMWIKPDKLWW
jgi:hypothetical protein